MKAAEPPPRQPWLRRARRWTFWSLVGLSLLSLVFSPLGPTSDRLGAVAPWLGFGLLATEILFVVGLGLMAAAAGVRLGWNPLRWRSRLPLVLDGLGRTRWFWLGLALNTVGAAGSALAVAGAIVAGLPARAWGLLVLPLADLGLTAAVRAGAVHRLRSSRTGPTSPTVPLGRPAHPHTAANP